MRCHKETYRSWSLTSRGVRLAIPTMASTHAESTEAPAMPAEINPTYAAAYEQLFGLCSGLRLDPPWNFVPVDEDCRGPLADAPAALAVLRQ